MLTRVLKPISIRDHLFFLRGQHTREQLGIDVAEPLTQPYVEEI